MDKDPTADAIRNESFSNVNVEEGDSVDTKEFSENLKEKLFTLARQVIEGTEEKIGKQPKWVLRFFPPKTDAEIERRRQLIYRELDGHYNEEDLQVMREKGLTLGGIRTPDEEVAKAIKFLVEREMDRRGQLKNLLSGYAVLDLGGKQITIEENSYGLKYGGVTDLDGVVKYLLQSE